MNGKSLNPWNASLTRRGGHPILRSWLLFLAAGVATTCSTNGPAIAAKPAAAKTPKALAVTVVKQFPHDSKCFTEGLHFTSSVPGGGFYESCGLVGNSTIQLSSLNGNLLVRESVPDRAFAEGTVALGNRVYQLTWQERKVFVRDPKTLKILETRELPKPIAEGWGMTATASALVVSDGTANVHFLDPKSWKVTRSINVKNSGIPVNQINELDFVDGRLWANIWQTEQLICINPKTGAVQATISLEGLRPPETAGNPEAVPNGIAYDPKTKRIFVTGKLWPVIYQVTTKPT